MSARRWAGHSILDMLWLVSTSALGMLPHGTMAHALCRGCPQALYPRVESLASASQQLLYWCAGELSPYPTGPLGLRRSWGTIAARRLQAAIAQGIVSNKYKTEACALRPCRWGVADCWFYHSEEDHLPLLGYKSRFCKAWQVCEGLAH